MACYGQIPQFKDDTNHRSGVSSTINRIGYVNGNMEMLQMTAARNDPRQELTVKNDP